VAAADDVLAELNPHLALVNVQQLRLDLDGGSGKQTGLEMPAVSDGSEAPLLALLHEAGQPVHVDQLARTLALPVHEVTGTLALLEVQGRVRHVGGMRYVPAR
jgi:DNA processing protein